MLKGNATSMLAAVGFGLLATAVASKKMQNPAAGSRAAPKTVVVAAADVPLGTKIVAEHLRTITWPTTQVPEGFIPDEKQVVGRVVRSRVFAGEPILASKLAPEGSRDGLLALIPMGMRGMTVQIDKAIQRGGLLVPGCRVDVVVTVDPIDRQSPATSKTFVQNVDVLAVGERGEDQSANKFSTKSVVTLLVTPAQAEQFALAIAKGKIQLIVRNTSDPETRATSGTTTCALIPEMARTPPKAPEAPPKGPDPDKLFAAAQARLRMGDETGARAEMERLVRQFPGTEAAKRAETSLTAMRQSAMRVKQHAAWKAALEDIRQKRTRGNFSAARGAVGSAATTFGALQLPDGVAVTDVLAEEEEQIDRHERRARTWYQLQRNYETAGLAAKAKQCSVWLASRYPDFVYTPSPMDALRTQGRDDKAKASRANRVARKPSRTRKGRPTDETPE